MVHLCAMTVGAHVLNLFSWYSVNMVVCLTNDLCSWCSFFPSWCMFVLQVYNFVENIQIWFTFIGIKFTNLCFFVLSAFTNLLLFFSICICVWCWCSCWTFIHVVCIYSWAVLPVLAANNKCKLLFFIPSLCFYF